MSWFEIQIGDLGQIVTGKTPPTKNKSFFDGPYQFVTPSDISFRNYYCRATAVSVTDEARNKFKNQFVPQNAIMFTCIGNTMGKCAISSETCLTNQQINSIVPFRDFDPKFVYYLMLHNVEKVRAIGIGGGSATPIVNKTLFSKITVKVPSKRGQHQIAKLLSAYDDLIENNRRRIHLLEQSARLLYKEWFVRLRFPGYAHVKIKEGVPEGWRKGTVSDFFLTSSGGTPSRKIPGFFGGTVDWVKTQELLGGFILATEEKITEEALTRSAAKIFPIGTVLVAMYGATIGQTGILAIPAASNQACCAVISQAKGADYAYAYMFFQENKETLKSLSQGAAQNNINQQIIKSLPMVLPARKVMNSFEAIAQPIFDQMKTLQMIVKRLLKVRDLLLPRLMNGEIEV